MKKIILLSLISSGTFTLIAQQTIPLPKTAALRDKISYIKVPNRDKSGNAINKEKDINGKLLDSITIEKKAKEQNVFGVFGVGNLNKEQLEKFNASGKFSCYVRPFISENSNLSFYLSFNKNATNNDSLLASTLIFPEVGNNSFLGTMEYSRKVSKKDDQTKEHFVVPFFEFSHKNIKASQDTGKGNSVAFHFSTLNYTLGCKYLFHYKRTIDNTEHDVYFSLAGYLSFLNIPDQDTADYRALLKSKTLSDNLWSTGLKVAVQYNNFSIFADFRHVLGSAARIPVRELRGFSSNIGVVFNAEIFGF